jgi:nucleotide-binding universal stress UspA family protein
MTQTALTIKDVVLVPTDFSDVSEFAIDHAIEIGKILNHKICLLHVYSPRSMGSDKLIMLHEEIEAKAEAIHNWTGLAVQTMIIEGDFLNVISEVADRINAEFIVLGIHGKKGAQQFIGGNVYKIVSNARIPVLIVKHMHHHVGYRNIVLPVDFSKKRSHRITQAIYIAKYFGATVRVFGYLSTSNPSKIIKKEALLKGITDIFAREQIPVTTDLWVNPGFDWSEALLKYAADIDADLIMMVANKVPRVPEFFHTSKTEQILDNADIPVLTVAPLEEYLEPDAQKKAFLKPFLDPLGLVSDLSLGEEEE